LERFYIVNIIINNREKAYKQVNELLHDFAEDIAFVWDTHYLKRTQPSSYWW